MSLTEPEFSGTQNKRHYANVCHITKFNQNIYIQSFLREYRMSQQIGVIGHEPKK